MPRHIEQPDSRHSKPARLKTSFEPLPLGLRLHLLRARHDHRAHACATFRPSTTDAAARRSSMREFVQEPMKTRSRGMSSIRVPGSSAM